MDNRYIPLLARIVQIQTETYDTKSFELEFAEPSVKERFQFKPGQFVEASVLGVGEAPFGLSSNPNHPLTFRITVRAVGSVTQALHQLKAGDLIGIRGPFGNGFPFDEVKGKNILFIGGGIGLPPLRSLIEPMLESRPDFQDIQILYGARTPADLVYKDRLLEWAKMKDLRFIMTVDVGDATWTGDVGVVTTLFPKADLKIENTMAFVCGPPIMIKFVIQGLIQQGLNPKNIISTLERYMKCGIGKCGHCAVGHKYICLDGPVFSYQEMLKLPENVV
jgi:sulfhydrogenase subunit gamma (sulfur reductase)